MRYFSCDINTVITEKRRNGSKCEIWWHNCRSLIKCAPHITLRVYTDVAICCSLSCEYISWHILLNYENREEEFHLYISNIQVLSSVVPKAQDLPWKVNNLLVSNLGIFITWRLKTVWYFRFYLLPILKFQLEEM